LIVAFIDELRVEGHAVESICRVLREQGVQVAARTYRNWSQASRPIAARVVSDAIVVDKIRDLAWQVDEQTGVRKMTPEGLYGRRKMTALVRRSGLPDASRGSVDRGMRLLGLSGVRRDKKLRTTIPAKDGKRAGDGPGLGHRLHLCQIVGGVGLCRVHPRRLRPADRGLARRDL